MEECDMNNDMEAQCKRAMEIAEKKKKGPLVKGKQGMKFDSAKHQLQKAKLHAPQGENKDPTQ